MADQSDAIMSAYKESLSSVTNKLGEEKSRSAQTVAERLAARKRLREQRLTREVNDEVLNEVGLGKVSSAFNWFVLNFLLISFQLLTDLFSAS